MRVRIIRWPDPVSSQALLSVERWCAGHWEPVRKFQLGESDIASEFALKLSMSKRNPVETIVFEDGEKVDPSGDPMFITAVNQHPAVPENSP